MSDEACVNTLAGGEAADTEQVRSVSERFDLFVSLICQLNRSIRRIKGFEMRAMGLRGVHVMILFHMNLHPEGLTQTRLATLCAEDKATISRAVQDLTEMGVIASDPSTLNRRNVKLTLTEHGNELAGGLGERIRNAVEAGAAGLPDKARDLLYSMLERVNDNLAAYRASMEGRRSVKGAV